jgi:hypothetical protein
MKLKGATLCNMTTFAQGKIRYVINLQMWQYTWKLYKISVLFTSATT